MSEQGAKSTMRKHMKKILSFASLSAFNKGASLEVIKIDGTVKSAKIKARESLGMRRT